MHPTPELVAAVQAERLQDAERRRWSRLAICCCTQSDDLLNRLARSLRIRPNEA